MIRNGAYLKLDLSFPIIVVLCMSVTKPRTLGCWRLGLCSMACELEVRAKLLNIRGGVKGTVDGTSAEDIVNATVNENTLSSEGEIRVVDVCLLFDRDRTLT